LGAKVPRGATSTRGDLSKVGVGAPVSDPRLGLPMGARGATEGLLRGLSRVGVGEEVPVLEGLPTGASGATEGLLRGFSRVGVGEYVVFPIGVRGASEGFCSGENDGLLSVPYVGELVLRSTGTARGSEVLYATVGSAVGIGVGSRLKSDGVGFIDTKSDFVGWSVTDFVSSFVGASEGCSQ